MSLEPEFLAMREINRAMDRFEKEEDRERLVAWTISKYGAKAAAPLDAASIVR